MRMSKDDEANFKRLGGEVYNFSRRKNIHLHLGYHGQRDGSEAVSFNLLITSGGGMGRRKWLLYRMPIRGDRRNM